MPQGSSLFERMMLENGYLGYADDYNKLGGRIRDQLARIMEQDPSAMHAGEFGGPSGDYFHVWRGYQNLLNMAADRVPFDQARQVLEQTNPRLMYLMKNDPAELGLGDHPKLGLDMSGSEILEPRTDPAYKGIPQPRREYTAASANISSRMSEMERMIRQGFKP